MVLVESHLNSQSHQCVQNGWWMLAWAAECGESENHSSLEQCKRHNKPISKQRKIPTKGQRASLFKGTEQGLFAGTTEAKISQRRTTRDLRLKGSELIWQPPGRLSLRALEWKCPDENGASEGLFKQQGFDGLMQSGSIYTLLRPWNTALHQPPRHRKRPQWLQRTIFERPCEYFIQALCQGISFPILVSYLHTLTNALPRAERRGTLICFLTLVADWWKLGDF